MVDSRAGARNKQEDPGASCSNRVKKCSKNKRLGHVRDTGANRKDVSIAKTPQITLDDNKKYKINIHVTTVI